jgi:hypothetical protein
VVDEHDRAAVGRPFRDGGVERAACGLIEPGPRLVKHEKTRPGQQRLRDRDLLAHPLRQGPQRLAGHPAGRGQ